MSALEIILDEYNDFLQACGDDIPSLEERQKKGRNNRRERDKHAKCFIGLQYYLQGGMESNIYLVYHTVKKEVNNG